MGLTKALDPTRSVAPNRRMSLSDEAIEIYRAALVVERDALVRSSVATAGSRAPVTLDQQSVGRLSRMDAIQVQAMAHAEEERRRARLRAIDAALARIGAEEYGYCLACGVDIAPRRLDVDPAAPRCFDCAK